MVSQEQITANKINALKGGVKTTAGKQVTRLNALSHGLTSKEILIRGENPEEFEQLQANLRAELEPQGTLEEYLVDTITVDMWRISRCFRLESQCLDNENDHGFEYYSKDPSQLERALMPIDGLARNMMINRTMGEGGTVSKLERYRTTVERHIARSLEQLKNLQDRRLKRRTVDIK